MKDPPQIIYVDLVKGETITKNVDMQLFSYKRIWPKDDPMQRLWEVEDVVLKNFLFQDKPIKKDHSDDDTFTFNIPHRHGHHIQIPDGKITQSHRVPTHMTDALKKNGIYFNVNMENSI